MPKMKTNRLAKKKFKLTGSGRFKRAQANTSHNTGKKSNSKMRKLRQRKFINDRDHGALVKLLPYGT